MSGFTKSPALVGPLPRALLAALLALSGCGAGSATDPTGPEAPTLPVPQVIVQPWRDPRASTGPTSAAGTSHLTYYGGRVVSNTQVVQVLWGTGSYIPNVSSTTSPSIASFFQGVLNSAYIDWLGSEYNTSTQSIGRGGFVGLYNITPSTTATTIDDSVIRSELAAQIAAGKLPAPTTDAKGNNNTYYAVFFPKGKSISMGSGRSCVSGGFCAYHGTISNAGGHEVYYGVHPDMQAGSGCDVGCGSNATPFNNLTSVASHELVEMITDPEVGLATSYAPPLGWYDSVHGEIGDICNAQQGTIAGSDGVTYTVQTEFSNASSGCIVSKAPTNDFSLTTSSATLSLAAGKSTTLAISTALTTGVSQAIALSVTGAPTGVTASLSPTSVTTGGASTLTVTTAATAASGSYPLTLTAKGASATHTATVTLTVVGNGFTLSATPSSLSLNAGGRGTSTIATAVSSGAAQTIAFSVTGAPAGVTATFSPASVTAGASSTLTVVSTTAAPTGTYALIVTGTAPSGKVTTTVALAVAGSNFTISPSVTALSLNAGSSATATINTAIAAGLAETVTFSASGAPTGVTATFSPASIASGGHVTLTVAATAAAPGGAFTLTLTGTAPSGAPKTATLTVTVLKSEFTITAATAALNIANGKTGSSLLSTTVTLGSAQALTFTATGLPTGATIAFSPASISSGASTTATITVGTATPAATSTITITAKGASATHTVTLTLTVPAPAPTGLVNGGFESQLTGWTGSGTPALATPGHTGTAFFGFSANASTSESSVSQTFIASTGKTKLSVWYQTNCHDSLANDWATITLKNNATGVVTTVLPKTCVSSSPWTNVTSPVTAGVSYTVTLTNHDTAAGAGPTFTAFDDVTLQ
jgi:uncharacterized membrane protein